MQWAHYHLFELYSNKLYTIHGLVRNTHTVLDISRKSLYIHQIAFHISATNERFLFFDERKKRQHRVAHMWKPIRHVRTKRAHIHFCDAESQRFRIAYAQTNLRREDTKKKKKQYQPGNKMPPEINDVFMWKQRRNEKQIMSKERKQNNKQQRKQRSNNKYILEKHNNNNYTNWLLKFGHEHINICCLCASIQIGYRTLRTVLRPLITCSTYKSSALLWQLKAWKKNKSNKIGATVDRWMSNEWMRWM